MLSSATACAPITAHNATGSVSNLAAFAEAGPAGVSTTSPAGASASTSAGAVGHAIPTSLSEQSRPLQGLAERFHGLTERLGSLGGGGGNSAGHSRTESDASNRTRTGESFNSSTCVSFMLMKDVFNRRPITMMTSGIWVAGRRVAPSLLGNGKIIEVESPDPFLLSRR